MTPIVVGLGANLGDPIATLRAAVRALPVARVSGAWLTAPVGPVADQPPFVNAAAQLATELAPRALLAELLALEARFGRHRAAEQRQGPRALDLDLLLYGDRVVDEPGLVVPHPRLHERAFALAPVAELLGRDFVLPRVGRTLGACLDDPAVRAQSAQRLPDRLDDAVDIGDGEPGEQR